MSSLYKKVISGKSYYYLREMARVDGQPKMVSERYLGTVADIVAAMDRVEAAMMPLRTGHLEFGAVAAGWSVLTELDVVAVIDEVVGPRRSDAGASIGQYLALAALGRLVEPGSKSGFAQWWGTTAADRFTRVGAGVLDHRRFWDAMHAVDAAALQDISTRLAKRMIGLYELDMSSVALDMTNFATYIDTRNDKAPIAQRGKAKQKRTDLRLVGLGMVVTRNGGIPLVWHAYPGNRPDVTQFATLIDHLAGDYTHLAGGDGGTAGAGVGGGSGGADLGSMTVVFDAGQNSAANFAHLTAAGLHYVGSVPPSDCPDLLALPAGDRRIVGKDRYPGVTAIDTRREVYGTDRRVVLTHSQTLHDDQVRSFTGTTLAKTGRQLDELAATLARGKTRRSREQLLTEIGKITNNDWGEAGVGLGIDRRHPGAAPTDLDGQPGETRSVGKQRLRQTDPDYRPGRLAGGGRCRRVPVAIGNRIRVPSTQRPSRGVVLPDAPLDRQQHRRAHLHLCAGPADRPPAAVESPPRRPPTVGESHPGHPRRYSRDSHGLPVHRWPTQSPPTHHRHDRRPTGALRPVRVGQMGTGRDLGHTQKRSRDTPDQQKHSHDQLT
jgi:hypothetical protein